MQKINIQTERLELREFNLSDIDFKYQLNSNPEVVKYTGDRPFEDYSDAKKVIYYIMKQFDDFGTSRFVVMEKNSNEDQLPLGWCGIKFHPDENLYEIGYRFFEEQWGKGYATESSLAVIDWFKSNFPQVKDLFCHAMVDNIGSINVMKKLGFKFHKTFYEHDKECVQYHLSLK